MTREAHLWLVEEVRRDRDADLLQQLRHQASVTHMTRDDLRHLDVLQSGHALNGPQPRHGVVSTAGGAEQVPQHPVVGRKGIDEPPTDGGPCLEPRRARSSDGRSEDENVLDKSISLVLRQLDQGVYDGSGAEGKADEGYGPDTGMALHDRVGEDETCGARPVQGVGPRVVNQVSELGQDCVNQRGRQAPQV